MKSTIEEMLDELRVLDELRTYKAIIAAFGALTERIAIQDAQLLATDAMLTEANERIAELEAEKGAGTVVWFAQLTAECDALAGQVTALEAQLNEINKKNTRLTDSVDTLEDEVLSLEEELLNYEAQS